MVLHDGAAPVPQSVWTAWSGDPLVLAGLAVSAWLYWRGRRRKRFHHQLGSGRREAIAFWAGWAFLAVALASPLHALGQALLWAHMAQHELLMVLAAPLLVLGRPVVVTLRGLPAPLRRRAGRWLGRLGRWRRRLTRLEVAWALHAAAVLLWHVPALYGSTLASAPAHWLQHASFLATALLFWWSVLRDAPREGCHGGAILSLFATSIYSGGLGALLTVADRIWYPDYGTAGAAWGLAPLQDQQLAGVIMWVPAGLSYLAAALWLTAAWLRDSETAPGVSRVTDPTPASVHCRT